MADIQGMAEHHAAITVNAPVHQVYGLFTHFNDFPKFMSFVKEVTYYDQQRSHWVAEVVGRHEWDAVNESWTEDRQIGWHSTNGLENAGRVTFQPMGTNQTRVDVYINYNPPAGVLGDIGENLGAGSRFDSVLQHDMDNFATMVDQAPPGALDPTASNYLFHSGSAAAKGTATGRQNETMDRENPGQYGQYTNTMNTDTTGYATNPAYPDTTNRPVLDRDIINEDTVTNPTYTGTQGGVMPNEGGMRNPVMPNEEGTRNPVMPDESGVTNPVMPPDRGTTTY